MVLALAFDFKCSLQHLLPQLLIEVHDSHRAFNDTDVHAGGAPKAETMRLGKTMPLSRAAVEPAIDKAGSRRETTSSTSTTTDMRVATSPHRLNARM